MIFKKPLAIRHCRRIMERKQRTLFSEWFEKQLRTSPLVVDTASGKRPPTPPPWVIQPFVKPLGRTTVCQLSRLNDIFIFANQKQICEITPNSIETKKRRHTIAA
ncbi:hypothetical protein M514_02944 [Trichuris suis]|uniref:Uncharacterized protein n=1 Tax=Trichuris suis TaxID=68888 RepID=A0A085NB47_9BILA|nr:hypothetical protein M514_02944 [Trichuris suis]